MSRSRELLPASLEVHLAFHIEHDLHGPPAEIAARFPQGHRGRLSTDEKFGERVQELLLAERVVIDEDDKLEVLVAGAVFFLRRWRACDTTAPAPAAAMTMSS
jgi:hypothetical protein